MLATSKPTPIALRREIDVAALCAKDPCELVQILGSFWPGSKSSFESSLVKGFKECCPVGDFQPCITELGEFYADRAAEKLESYRFDWVVRVLSSMETKPDDSRPMALLADVLCKRLNAQNLTHLLFKSESRPSMRSLARLSGSESLDRRVGYVLQDLFIKPTQAGGSVLLIDDIFNTGASMRVYAQALKLFAGVDRVIGLNLAATRFDKGKDGLGYLTLDTSSIDARPGFELVWVDKKRIYHNSGACPSLIKPISAALSFVAQRKASACPACCEAPKAKRKWWNVLG